MLSCMLYYRILIIDLIEMHIATYTSSKLLNKKAKFVFRRKSFENKPCSTPHKSDSVEINKMLLILNIMWMFFWRIW